MKKRSLGALGLLYFSFLVFLGSPARAAEPVFRFHLINEPASLKPWEQKNSAAGYFLSQIVGTLLVYQDQKLSSHLAEKCEFQTATKIQCTLRKNLKWSDQKPIRAQDYARAFQEFISKDNKAFRADLLFPVKNAKKIFAGEMKKESLGVSAPNDRLLQIDLEKSDPEFLYTLSSPLLAPLPETPLANVEDLRKNPNLWKSSGPHMITSWDAQKKISLKPNPEYFKKNSRPLIEIRMVAEDSVALNLYEKGELNFLRRLPTLFIPKFKNRPDFFEIEQFRFDYLGFSNKWKSEPQLRKALSQTLRYTDLQKMYQAKGAPGCPGIPDHLHTEKICLEFNLEKAQKTWAELAKKPTQFEVLYSRQGGDDHKRTMEWLQSEWQKNLKFSVDLNALENKIFTDRLEKNPPDLFRKGLAPDRPTCLSALENFESKNPENYIRFSNPSFDELIEKMRKSSKESEKKKLCDQGLHALLDEAWIIPTGPIHFTLLAAPQFKGWKLNELNQLDLSELAYQK